MNYVVDSFNMDVNGEVLGICKIKVDVPNENVKGILDIRVKIEAVQRILVNINPILTIDYRDMVHKENVVVLIPKVEV